MEHLVRAVFKVGDKCTCAHPYTFRSRQPFTVISISYTYTWRNITSVGTAT